MSAAPTCDRPTPGTPKGGEIRGTIFNVQRASFHDGPGIRTTVFLKGCPLRCPWCHNPEGIAFAPEVMVDQGRCLSCGACVAACPRADGPLPAGAAVGGDGCAAEGRCAAACPTGARQVAGRAWGVDELLAELLRDRMTYEESGGGVTFSGGEPLAQPRFLTAALDACRAAGLHVAVDTCGFAPRRVVAAAADRADLLLWDVKLLDPERHLAATGVALEPILANLAAVARRGTPIWLRMPVIPGVNDDDTAVGAAVRLAAASRAVRCVCLLPYHATAAGKRARLGRAGTLADTPRPSQERLEAIAARFEAAGVAVRIGG